MSLVGFNRHAIEYPNSTGFNLDSVEHINTCGYDGILVISHDGKHDESIPKELRDVLKEAFARDAHFEEEISILQVDLSAKRLIYSPTGQLNNDYADVRSYSDAGRKGITRALKAGVKSPLVVLSKNKDWIQAELAGLLGVLEGLYMNLQYREDVPSKFPKVKLVGVLGPQGHISELTEIAASLECGRIVARDIGGADPERMTPIKVEEYLKKVFPADGVVKMEVISDEAILQKEYPLFAAVNRAASVIDRHKGRIVYLTYEGPKVTETLYIVGKGVTFDSGGADIKISGNMIGMSKDKCGAAAAAGFMKVISLFQPQYLKVVVGLGLVRNSVGENGYVADEIITSRAGKRVRVINTDAEGRFVMADILCRLKEQAVKSVNPHLFTIATLTGHAFRTVGPGYTIIMDNGPARKKYFAHELRNAGDQVGDMIEESTIRREDYEAYRGKVEGEDVLQADHSPGAQAKRGHQGAAAFLILASGLDKHGLTTETPLKFTHLDIAASAGLMTGEVVTGAPVLALSTHFLHLKKDY